MSKRPKIVDRHEKKVEGKIQRRRRARDREMREAAKGARPSGIEAKPHILSFSRGPVEGGVPKKVQEWIEAESRDQDRHYRRIFRQVEKLAPLREGWAKDFLKRISGPRGFSVHAGTRKTIAKKDIPKKPRRPWRVVW